MNFHCFQTAFNMHTCVFFKQENTERVKCEFDIEEEEQDLEQVKYLIPNSNAKDLML